MPGLAPFSDLLGESYRQWRTHRAPQMAAALAFYSLISMAPVLVIVIAVAGAFFGHETTEGRITEEIGSLIGTAGSEAVREMIHQARRPASSVIVGVLGLFTMIFGATRAFDQLQDALDTIWSGGSRFLRMRGGLGALVRKRLFSFLMVLGTGFLLLISLVVSAALASATRYFQAHLPDIEALWLVIDQGVGFAVTAFLFFLIFKTIPRAAVGWGEAFAGGLLTAFLFSIGRALIGLYLGRGAFSNVYGVAGSLTIVLFWIYYTSQILFFGAEFAAAVGRRRNRPGRGMPLALLFPEDTLPKQTGGSR